jgi:hypothetical protein
METKSKELANVKPRIYIGFYEVPETEAMWCTSRIMVAATNIIQAQAAIEKAYAEITYVTGSEKRKPQWNLGGIHVFDTVELHDDFGLDFEPESSNESVHPVDGTWCGYCGHTGRPTATFSQAARERFQ